MLFELHSPEVSVFHAALQPAAKLFQAKQPVEAYAGAMVVIRGTNFNRQELSEFDWLLLSAIAQHAGEYRRVRCLHKLATIALPKSPVLIALHAWDRSADGKYFAAKDLIEKALTWAEGPQRALLSAVMAYNYSLMGWCKTARRWHDETKAEAGDNPIIWYVLSRASARRTDWQQAVEEGTTALRLAPSWARAKTGLSDSSLATGNFEAAERALAADANEIPSGMLQFSRAACLESMGKLPAAISGYQQLLTDWPAKYLSSFTARRLMLLLIQTGQQEAADALVEQFDLSEFKSQLGDNQDRSSCYISLPLVAQTTNHCVPTVAAMVANSQGVVADPAHYAEGMNTRHGTQLWRMVDFMKSLGFRAVCVRPEVDIVKALLDQGVPLIGQLKGLFMGHVDAICGYNSQLELFHVRDPMHWHGSCLKYDQLNDRYKNSCSLWALIPPHRIKEVQIDSSWLYHEAQALIDLSRACDAGNRLEAEAAYARIAPTHGLRHSANEHGCRVTITQSDFDRELKALVDHFEAGESDAKTVDLNTVKAMLQFLNADNADRILDVARQNVEKLNTAFVRYVAAQCLYAKGQWQDALTAFTQLCHRSPSSEQLWRQLSNVQQQLGLHEQAKSSLDIAIEIAPENEVNDQQILRDERHEILFAQRLERVQALVADAADTPAVRLTLATVLVDGADGAQYEASLRDCIKYFPRYPWPYERLANWYYRQDREDLAAEVLQAGRALMGEVEMPKWGFEEQAEASATATEADSESDVESVEAAGSDQPEDGTTSAEPSVTESASPFDEAWQRLRKLELTTYEEFAASEPFHELKTLTTQNKVHWWQTARFVAYSFYTLMNDNSAGMNAPPTKRSVTLAEILPDQIPGIPELFVTEVFDSIDVTQAPLTSQRVLHEWAGRQTPNKLNYPTLRFELAYLVECMGQLNDSEAALREIVQRHPAYSGALYRLGQICERRGDLLAAEKFYDQCIEACPGHWGSLNQLCEVSSKTGHKEVERKLDRLKCHPYNATFIGGISQAISRLESPEAGHQFVDEQEDKFESGRFHIFKARLFYTSGRHDEALALLDRHDDPADLDYSAAWLRIHCGLDKGEYESLVPLLERMSEKWPLDQETIEQHARVLREISTDRAKTFAKEKLLAGSHIYLLAYICLQNEATPAALAQSMVETVDEADRASLAGQLGAAIRSAATNNECIKFLRYCHDQFPHLRQLRVWLAYDYCDADQAAEGKVVAEQLLAEQPDNPEYLELAGYCLQGLDIGKAVDYLQQAYSVTGKVDTLAEIGRAHQIAGNRSEAKKVLRETLNVDPYNTTAMTNLMWCFNDQSPSIWFAACRAIESPGAAALDVEQFLVSAAQLARTKQMELPTQWLKAAVERAELICDNGGFQDEQFQLSIMLQQWLANWQPANSSNGSSQSQPCWIPAVPNDYDCKRDTGKTYAEIESLAFKLTQPVAYSNGVTLIAEDAITSMATVGENYVQENDLANAALCFRQACRNFDSTVSRQARLHVVQRLVDVESGGSMLDRLNRFVPGDQRTNLLYVLYGAVAVPFVILHFLLNRQFGLSTTMSSQIMVGAICVVLALWHFARGDQAAKRLEKIQQERDLQDMIDEELAAKDEEATPTRQPEASELVGC